MEPLLEVFIWVQYSSVPINTRCTLSQYIAHSRQDPHSVYGVFAISYDEGQSWTLSERYEEKYIPYNPDGTFPFTDEPNMTPISEGILTLEMEKQKSEFIQLLQSTSSIPLMNNPHNWRLDSQHQRWHSNGVPTDFSLSADNTPWKRFSYTIKLTEETVPSLPPLASEAN